MVYFGYVWLFNIETGLSAGLGLSQDGFHDATETSSEFAPHFEETLLFVTKPYPE